ncbi:DUF721 domain-containing protein [Desulfofustis limnaeus]|jgi:hypothetical protein|uniref:DUF721 domain-containing protein n=1 Tax=Desulfofustis limnaeus TaxID=2740163 RepID=A0ABN6M6F9_9BACT|nr:DUF721 domain-containing protein [Desulfofustis limnaeus]MDX9895716.1 DUF721 domain-containing protein [Desulfofustis sp.]BDD88466.1 hypothetical protein DPPLL_28310 [Desulfofustis limnaeus]
MNTRENRLQPTLLAAAFSTILKDKDWNYKHDQYRVFSDWSNLVDPDTAVHSRPLKVVKDVLWLAVENSAWMQQLRFQKLHLLETLNNHLRISRFSDIRFTLQEERRQPTPPREPVVRFVPPPEQEVEAFRQQISFIDDEAIRESLLRLWYLAQACRRE